MSVSGPHPFVYLASQSPRRRQLLEQVGVAHELLLPEPGADTESIELELPGELPQAYVRRVTGLKLDAAMQRLRARGLPLAPVLCSDTTVALGERIFGKPADAAHARSMLRELAGATHRVLTAVAIGHGDERHEAVSDSQVTFEPLSTEQIDRYVATGEPLGKAGAYAIQGRMALHVTRISGSYSGIMGLPLFETGRLLRAVGWPS